MKQFNLDEYLKNPSRKVVTRTGIPVKIHCTNFISLNKPVIAEIDGWHFSQSFSKEGRSHSNTDDTNEDLFFATEKHEGWVNIYKDGDHFYSSMDILKTKDKAEALSCRSCIATVKIEWEE